MEKDIRGDKYYVMQYTAYGDVKVLHITDVRKSWLDAQERHKGQDNFKFWEVDRFGMTMNCR